MERNVHGYAVRTVLIGLIFFCSVLPLFLSPNHDKIAGTNKIKKHAKENPPRSGMARDRSYFDGSNATNTATFHFLVSSGCSPYQFWQVITQIHSARSVGQEGKYTWIVSGCDQTKHSDTDSRMEDQLVEVFESHFASFSREAMLITDVHFTPDYSDMSVYGGPFADGKTKRTFVNAQGEILNYGYGNHYHFNNKPNGLRHWAEAHDAELQKSNDLIVLIDPDFLFVAHFSLPLEAMASPGSPVGALHALNFDAIEWMDLNVSSICGGDSPCTNVTVEEHRQHYSAGPPYVIHAHDVLALAAWWSKFVPPTYDQYPTLYAEMFAYSIASAHLELRHTLVEGLVAGCMVPWPDGRECGDAGPSAKAFVAAGADSENPVWDGPSSCFLLPLKPPPLLHYCQRYAFKPEDTNASYSFVAKRLVPHDILNCDSPTKFLSPFSSSNQNERIYGGNEDWTALVVCAVLRAVNYARNSHCGNDA